MRRSVIDIGVKNLVKDRGVIVGPFRGLPPIGARTMGKVGELGDSPSCFAGDIGLLDARVFRDLPAFKVLLVFSSGGGVLGKVRCISLAKSIIKSRSCKAEDN